MKAFVQAAGVWVYHLSKNYFSFNFFTIVFLAIDEKVDIILSDIGFPADKF